MSSPYAWANQWPLPTFEEVQDKLIGNRTLTAADRLALFRDGVLTVTDANRRDEALAQAARGAFFEGKHGQQRPVVEWSPFAIPTIRDDTWPMAHTDVWPAWEGEAWEVFAHRAHVALWLAEGANPWIEWGRDKNGSWGLPEILLAAGDSGLLRRVMGHPDTPDLATLAQRRLSPLAQSRGLSHVPWLHAAAGLKTPSILDDLLARGMDPSAPDDRGRTPLFYAANAMQMERLLIAGANPLAQDGQQESVRRFWARTATNYATAIEPLLDQYERLLAPTAPSRLVSEADIQAAFGLGAQGQWEPVVALMNRSGSTWNTWRQPVTLKNGQVKEASWMGAAALGIMVPSNDPQKKVAYEWHMDSCHVIEATQKMLDEATPDSFDHETLSGLTDGQLWYVMGRSIPYLQAPSSPVTRHGNAERERQELNNTYVRRFRSALHDWGDKVTHGADEVVVEGEIIAGMAKNINTWGVPSFWREQILFAFIRLVGGLHGSRSLWERDRGRCPGEDQFHRELSDLDFADMATRWTVGWQAVAQAMMIDKSVRGTLSSRVLKTFDRYGGPHASTQAKAIRAYDALIPLAARQSLAGPLWLAVAEEQKADSVFMSEMSVQSMGQLWARWEKEGVKVDPVILGSRGVTLLREQFPALFPDLALPPKARSRRSP